MRLLHYNKDGNISLTGDIQNIPAYAILFHTWGTDEDEVTFKDIQEDLEYAKFKPGYRKIQFCGKEAVKADLEYVEERMAWAEKRETKKEEDKAYSLLGIFNVFMLPIYGEGTENAFYRLKEEIKKRATASADQALTEGLPVLQNDSIFLQERLLVRSDVQSFLTQALGCSGHVRVVLHGLPGIGSETAIKDAFVQYARQMLGNDQQFSEPKAVISHQLAKRFPGR
ncbi:hypothetical protein E0Z10_g9818 [Xylaria hypoxylon]|uniref:Uncharacterized protein n=1 Tax=Xylaria hypoxylon TaxID=37992 RepID=A0A4Z0Y4D9_9PEZI|nr:hypothetical protein E0Z10_g9818 [Xylaria hypoxylon]